jgi:hypothetical protein
MKSELIMEFFFDKLETKFQWLLLLYSLMPQHKVSLVNLVHFYCIRT